MKILGAIARGFILLLLTGLVLINQVKAEYPADHPSRIQEIDISFVEAIKEISMRFEVFFTFDLKLVEGIMVDDSFREYRSVENAVEYMLQKTSLKYRIIQNQYVIIYKDDTEGIESLRQMSRHLDGLISEGEKSASQPRKKDIRVVPSLKRQTSLSSIEKIAFNVDGKVTDQKGEALIGVNIQVKGTNKGTATDLEGNFTLEDIDENAVLVISYIGYVTQEVSVAGNRNINITMVQNSQMLNEVVVVGYGTQKKANLTGAVASISSDKLENKPLPNVGEVLRGVSPNLNINLGSYGAEPGAGLSFNIRGMGSISGNSAPLILVDGVEMNINNLDPSSIEEVTVLKDASSAAIYGSRAPFGVILITTKKGNKGEGIKIQYNNNLILGKSLGIPHMENSLIFATVYNQAATNAGSPPQYPAEQMDRIRGFIDGTYKTEFDPDNPTTSIWTGRRIGNANYDWPHILFKDYKFDQRHNVSVSGSTDKTQYFVSMGYFDQNGFYGAGYDEYKRYDILANLTLKATDWLDFSLSTKYANTHTDYPIGITTVERRYIGNSLFSFGPIQPRYNPDGSLANPIERYLQSSGRDKTDVNDLLTTLAADFEPIEGWNTRFSYNYNITELTNGTVSLPVPVELGNGEIGNVGKPNSAYESSFSHSPYKLFNVVTSYEMDLGKHFFKVLAGYEQEEKSYNSLYGRKEGLISEIVPSISTALGQSTLQDNKYDWATKGYFGRINYNFEEKYLLEFSARYNGSSRFDPESRWGFFPSASAGYQLSKEEFWQPIQHIVNQLKIRGSYGSLGNQNVAAYLYIPTINVRPESAWIISDSRPPYATIPRIISDNLTWETITMTNFGIDAQFLNYRLGVTLDVFNRETTNMFGPQETLPYTLGTGTPTANNASMSTKGFELIFDWNDMIGSEFSYNAQISIGDNRSKILQYRNDNGFIDSWYNGKEVGEIWGFVSDELIQSNEEAMPDQTDLYPTWGPGDMKYTDLNGDNRITEGLRTLNDHGDLKVIGNRSPRYNIGLGAGFNWKNLDFSMNWSGSLKQDYLPGFNVNSFWGLTNSWANSAVFKGAPVLDYWRPADESNILGPNTDAYFPKPYFSNETQKNRKPQSKYVLNAAYLRLRNLQIGYTLSPEITQNVAVQKARIFISGGNLITIKNLPKDIDPEQTIIGQDGYNSNGSFYPMSTSFTVGVNLTF